MIDPNNVTKFNRNTTELEEFLLFAIVVAGKNSFQQAQKLEKFLANRGGEMSPFEYIRWLDRGDDDGINRMLRQVKMGQYGRITTAFRGVANFMNTQRYSLHNFPINHFECIKGIGMKTARFFVMHTKRGQRIACLDTHILRWLGEKGHIVPKTTPQGEKYLALEKIFLEYCNSMGKSPAELDLQIWNEAHKKVETAS